MKKILLPKYYLFINGEKVEVVQQNRAIVEWEEVCVNEQGLSEQFIKASKLI